jgi:aminoglycoside phosphotransferase (APT) family kinase protein
MHEKIISELPSQKQLLRQKIISATALAPAQREAAISALDQLPTGNRLCHGDFHPDNIIMSTRGAVTIDWMTGSQGNPLADVARTSLLLQLGELPPGTPALIRSIVTAARGRFHKSYLQRYFKLRPDQQAEFAKWQLPILAARLGDDISAEQERLMALLAEST